MFLIDLIWLIIDIISQFLFCIGLEKCVYFRFLIAVLLSKWIFIWVLLGVARRREIIASSSVCVVSGYEVVAALNLIEVLFLQIQPIPDLIFDDCRFCIEASV